MFSQLWLHFVCTPCPAQSSHNKNLPVIILTADMARAMKLRCVPVRHFLIPFAILKYNSRFEKEAFGELLMTSFKAIDKAVIGHAAPARTSVLSGTSWASYKPVKKLLQHPFAKISRLLRMPAEKKTNQNYWKWMGMMGGGNSNIVKRNKFSRRS